MRKAREELRRGLRSLIQDAGAELAEFTGTASPERPRSGAGTTPAAERRSAPPAPPAPTIRPILKLVRDVSQPDAPAQPSLEEMALHLPRKGVCAAYFQNKRCWELPDAYCNHALHVCRLRECPVYTLHREDMERRFAAKFKHLW